jgi:hypothetical protein
MLNTADCTISPRAHRDGLRWRAPPTRGVQCTLCTRPPSATADLWVDLVNCTVQAFFGRIAVLLVLKLKFSEVDMLGASHDILPVPVTHGARSGGCPSGHNLLRRLQAPRPAQGLSSYDACRSNRYSPTPVWPMSGRQKRMSLVKRRYMPVGSALVAVKELTRCVRVRVCIC